MVRLCGAAASACGVLGVPVLVAIAAQPAFGQDICDNRLEAGEGLSPFAGGEYLIMANAMAEKACGAPAKSITSFVLDGPVKKAGCGPETEIYSRLRESMDWAAAADLKALAQDGDANRQMAPEQVQEWTEMVVDDFGGCPALLAFHRQLHSGALFGQ